MVENTGCWTIHACKSDGIGLVSHVICVQPGESIQLQTAVGSQAAEASASSRSTADKTAMVRAARQLLSAITKVLLLADRIVIKQLICSKDRVGTATGWSAWKVVCNCLCVPLCVITIACMVVDENKLWWKKLLWTCGGEIWKSLERIQERSNVYGRWWGPS